MLARRLSSLWPGLSPRPPRLQLHTSPAAEAKRWQEKSKPEYTAEFRNPVRDHRVVSMKGMKLNAPIPENGHIYDLKPKAVTVKAGCSYTWCGCGLARTEQPFCDLTCQNLYLEKVMKGGPVPYIATETKEVWFCNCKQSSHKPFCDGTHRSEEVQNHRFDSNRELFEPRVKRKIKKL